MTSLSPRAVARGKRWTYADYCSIAADGRRHELIGGRHFVNPAPDPYHQLVSIRLAHLLMGCIADRGLGIVLAAPVDVHLGPGSVLQPDLVAIRARNRAIVGPAKITGAPDLVVEILSPRTRVHDCHRKRDLYERAGVREFWLVDPRRRCIDQLVWRRGRFLPPIVATSSIGLRVFRGVTLALAEVW